MDSCENSPVVPASIAEIALVGGQALRSAYWATPLASWRHLAVEDVFLIAAMGEVLSPTAAFAMASSYLRHRVSGGDYSTATVEKLGGLISRFVIYTEKRFQITDVRDLTARHAQDWIRAPMLGAELRVAGERTRDNRRWALELFFKTLRGLDLYDGDPLLDATRVVRPASSGRPLLDAEMERCRKHARSSLGDTLGPVRVALAESMATASEVATVVVVDYDREGRRMWLKGSAARLAPRWASLLPWAAAAVEHRIADLASSDPMALLACTGSSRPDRAGAAISMALRKVLTSAGLSDDKRLKPGSFRAWGGRRLYDESADIEEVARRLGVRTLDSARRLIALPDPELDTPPPHRRSK